MTPPALAQAAAAAVSNASVPSTPDSAALDLLEQLVIASHRATAAAQHGDPGSLHELLDVRGEMITALEQLAKIVAPRIGPQRPRSKQSEAARTALLAKSNELQQLNVRLMQCVRTEAARLSVSIASADSGESTEAAYQPLQAERVPNLDLMR